LNSLSLAQSELVDIFVDAYVLYLKRFRHIPDVAAMERHPSDEPSPDALSGSEKELDCAPGPKHSWAQEFSAGECAEGGEEDIDE